MTGRLVKPVAVRNVTAFTMPSPLVINSSKTPILLVVRGASS